MSIKLFLICVWSVGVFSVRAAVPVEGIIYFKEGKSVGFSGDHRVCIPKKGKDVKAFRLQKLFHPISFHPLQHWF